MKSGDVELGWRLYVRSSGGDPSHPVVFYCHANAETAADVEHLAPLLHSAGAAAVFAGAREWLCGRLCVLTSMGPQSTIAAMDGAQGRPHSARF